LEYIVIGLLVVIIGLLWFKNPNKMESVVSKTVIARIEKDKEKIAKGVIDKLPKESISNIPEDVLVTGVTTTVDLALEVIEEGLKE
jgi:hypothetical protein